MHECISAYVSNYESLVYGKTDEQLLDDIQRSSLMKGQSGWWYMHEIPNHRTYLRMIRQEAHRRGLSNS